MVYEKAACKRFTGRFFMDVIPLLPLFPFNDGLRIVADERPFTVHDVQLQVHAAAAHGLHGFGSGARQGPYTDIAQGFELAAFLIPIGRCAAISHHSDAFAAGAGFSYFVFIGQAHFDPLHQHAG